MRDARRKATGTILGLYAVAGPRTANCVTQAVDRLELSLSGIVGDRHAGATRKAGPREPWLPRGMILRNDRQLSAVADDELRAIAETLGLDEAAPELLGANLLIGGVERFSRLGPGAHLAIGGAWGGVGQFDGTALLRVEAYNRPCRVPGRKLAAAHGRPELEFGFSKAARARRGLVLSVAFAGVAKRGDAVVVIPPLLAPDA